MNSCFEWEKKSQQILKLKNLTDNKTLQNPEKYHTFFIA